MFAATWRPAALAIALLSAGCGGTITDDTPPGTGNEPLVCGHEAPAACVEPAPVFADVEPIFQATCGSCHGETPGLWPLDSYSHIADWHVEIRAHLDGCTMPPRDAGVVLGDEDRELVLMWLKCGLRR